MTLLHDSKQFQHHCLWYAILKQNGKKETSSDLDKTAFKKMVRSQLHKSQHNRRWMFAALSWLVILNAISGVQKWPRLSKGHYYECPTYNLLL